ncbi:hypothetical protein JCM19297_162 [Nonlabens ulvanivorans]|nr:hypothetical protein [Nonlabens ulvanivorans]GAK90863.1 hypothetical protein JCM19297_162 [Nonlabens ulvanivorans]
MPRFTNTTYCVTSLLFLIYGIATAQVQAPGDCINAIEVCDTNPIYFETLGPGVIDDANGQLSMACHAKNSVNTYEDHTAFFKFKVNNSGQFGFYITPDVVEDWEWILFGPNPDCNDLPNSAWAECSSSTPDMSNPDGSTGLGPHPIVGGGGSANSFDPYINVTAGEEYVLMIMPFLQQVKKLLCTGKVVR